MAATMQPRPAPTRTHSDSPTVFSMLNRALTSARRSRKPSNSPPRTPSPQQETSPIAKRQDKQQVQQTVEEIRPSRSRSASIASVSTVASSTTLETLTSNVTGASDATESTTAAPVTMGAQTSRLIPRELVVDEEEEEELAPILDSPARPGTSRSYSAPAKPQMASTSPLTNLSADGRSGGNEHRSRAARRQRQRQRMIDDCASFAYCDGMRFSSY